MPFFVDNNHFPWKGLNPLQKIQYFFTRSFTVSAPQPKPAMTQDPGKTIDSLLKQYITPYLKAQGFTKTGHTYYRTRGDHQELINVQAGKWNSVEEGSLTFNLGIFIEEVCQAVSDQPIGLPHEYDCLLSERIGFIGKDGQVSYTGNDKWWKFDHQSDMSMLGTELVEVLRDRGLTYFEYYTGDQRILDTLLKNDAPLSRQFSAAMAVKMGDRERAQQLIEQAYNRKPEYRNSTLRSAARVAERLGLKLDPPTDEQLLIVRTTIAGDKPTPTERKIIDRLLSRLWDKLEDKTEYFDRFVFAPGTCELHYYSRDVSALAKRFEPALRSFTKKYEVPAETVLRKVA